MRYSCVHASFNVARRLKVPSPFNSFCVQCCEGERAYSNVAPAAFSYTRASFRLLLSASACARCLYLDVFLRRAVAVGAAGPSHLHARACEAHVFWFGVAFPLGHLLWASANGFRGIRKEVAASVHRDKVSSVLPTIWSEVHKATVVLAAGSGQFVFSAAFASRSSTSFMMSLLCGACSC